MTLKAVRRRFSIFGFSPLCLVDKFLRDPRSWGRFNTKQSDAAGRAAGAGYISEVVWALTATYTVWHVQKLYNWSQKITKSTMF